MDRTTRWETEAIRKLPPKPSRAKKSERRTAEGANPSPGTQHQGNWATLREAEAETGIPVNTLRKWIRRADLPSYLEADGDLALRMVDMDAVIARAGELGRDIVQQPESVPDAPEATTPAQDTGESTTPDVDVPAPDPAPADTMIVPVDAWNKMLNQLGNLHEAGQQLAEARERAAKAETEAKFLRVQLAENRSQKSTSESILQEVVPPVTAEPIEEAHQVPITISTDSTPDSTTYWRYLTSGWRDRKRRRD